MNDKIKRLDAEMTALCERIDVDPSQFADGCTALKTLAAEFRSAGLPYTARCVEEMLKNWELVLSVKRVGWGGTYKT